MKDDYYTYPDIDGDDKDIFSSDDLYSDVPSSLPDEPAADSDVPFRVTIKNDDVYSSRRPTARPAGERFIPEPQPNRIPTGRKMSEAGYRPQQNAPSYPQGVYYQGNERRQAPPPNSVNYASGRPVQYSQRPPQQPQRPPQVSQRPQQPQPRPAQRQQSFKDKKRSSPSQRERNIDSGKKVRSSSGVKKILAAVLCVFLALVILIGGYGFALLGKINYDSSTSGRNEYISSSELAHSGSVKNILIIGSDARSENEEMGKRSDTMILASVDKKSRQLKLTSFLRDSLVKIPARDSWNKLNASFSFGGAKMTIDTLEYNFKVKIDNYVIIDFEIFKEFIDALGGVDVDGITEAEVNWLKTNVKGINIHPGKSHLTGGAALWYCRVRKIDSDFKRTERQRKVVGAIIDKVKHTNPFTTFKAVKKVLPLITTDFNRVSLMNLGVNSVLRFMRYDIVQMHIPVDGTWTDKSYSSIGAVLEMDIDKNTEALKEFVFSKQEKEEKK